MKKVAVIVTIKMDDSDRIAEVSASPHTKELDKKAFATVLALELAKHVYEALGLGVPKKSSLD